MKRLLSIMFALAVVLSVLPLRSLGAKANTVDFYGNSVPADIRALRITRARYLSGDPDGEYYVPSDTPLDCELLAEKFPNLYVLEFNDGCVENTEALSKLKNLSVLKLTCNKGMGEKFGDLSFLEGLTNLRSLYISNRQWVNIDIAPLAKLTKLTELYLDFLLPMEYYDDRQFDISCLKNLTKMEKLTLYINAGDISPLKSMKELRELDVVGDPLKDGIDVLRKLPRLEYLRLYDASISEAKQLSGLKNLKTFKLLNCTFGSSEENAGEILNGIGKLKNLENFEFFYESLGCFTYRKRADLNYISNLKNLKTLKINGYLMTNCDFLKDLTSLEKLDLNNCGVSNISGLAGLTELKSLDIYDHRLSDISALEKLTKLERLYIGIDYGEKSQLKDVSVLSGLTELKQLFLDRNQKIKNFDFLKNLDKLELLDIESTGWYDQLSSRNAVYEFIKNHPDCEVRK